MTIHSSSWYAMQDPQHIRLKRKYCEVDEPPCYMDQRQSILNISMCKLKTTSLKRVEPSLRRSVLIFNTLRYIEHELKEEGVCSTPPTSLLPSLQHNSDFTLDPPPGAECSSQSDSLLSSVCIPRSTQQLNTTVTAQEPVDIATSASGVHHMDVSDVTDSSLATEQATRTNASVLSNKISANVNNNHIPYTQAHTTTGSTPQSTKDSMMDTTSNITSSSNNNVDVFAMVNFTSLYEDSLNTNNTTTSSQISPLPVVTATTTTTSQPLLKFEDILDIDLPLYDFDMFSPLSPSVKLTPLSAEDLIHALPSSSSFTDGFSTSCKNESLIDDLDHIMQILVGM